MKNDPALFAGLNEAILSVFAVEGDVDNLAYAAGLQREWVEFKTTSAQLELALNRFLQRVEAKRALVGFIDAALKKSGGAPEFQAIADHYVRPAREPLEALGAKLEDLEKVLFGDVGLPAVAAWADRLLAMSRAVCLIRPDPGSTQAAGTGFLVGPDLVLTSWGAAAPFWGKDDLAARASVEFDGEAAAGGAAPPCRLKPEWALPSSPAGESAFALLRLDRRAAEDPVGGKTRDYLKLSERSVGDLADLLAKGEAVLFLLHGQARSSRLRLAQSPRPDGGRFFRYEADAADGSAGAPCFSQTLEVIGLNGDGGASPDRGILASAVGPSIRDAVRRSQVPGPAAAIAPLQTPTAAPARKRALFIQPAARGLMARARADAIWAELITPAFEDTDYEPARSNDVKDGDDLEPLVSPLSVDPLVVADLGGPPWDPRVMMEVGFRIANAKPLILIADANGAGTAYPGMLEDLGVIRIDPDDIAASLPHLRSKIAEYRPGTADFWSSQYPYVDFQMPLDDPSQAVYIHANDAAARLYGLDRADDLVGKRVDEYDDRLYQFMPEPQRAEFVDEQVLLLGTILWPQKLQTGKSNGAVNASVRIPLWLANHAKPEFQGKIYLPLLVQHKIQKSRGVVLMRSVFVDISSWAAPGLSSRSTSTVLSLPEIFRHVRDYQFDVFLPCDADEADYVRHIRDTIEDLNCTVWFKGGGAEDPSLKADEVARSLCGARMAAIPISRRGLGRWEQRPGVRDALKSYLNASYPHLFLILPDVPDPDGWKALLPADYAGLVADSLFLPLQKLEGSINPVPVSVFVERIVRELFKVFRQQ
ncbi:hypothetical protein OJF2_75010 [Aquisphaera giovannonii]|uniref:PAS domain-containing protein n=1 Tax=Aquisphaera giovannonii TaxID=406548 RepID=A0A5B9WFX3_9BACT|nr:PAS domain-containing protein [Aquisphaera giovannonii]QEH38891.1 hypothetical protein OJF2_75010 [Aquisphaera giovannonii]